MRRTSTRGRLVERAWRHAVVLLGVGALAGCSPVYTTEPIGAVAVHLDPQDWNGHWAFPEDLGRCQSALQAAAGRHSFESPCLSIEVADAERGVLNIVPTDGSDPPVWAWVRTVGGVTSPDPRPSSDDERGATVRTPLRRHQRAQFVSMEDANDEASPRRLIWAWMARQDDALVLWPPDADAFRTLVRAGVIPGEAGNNDVSLPRLDGPSMDVVTGESRWDLFDWEQPLVLVRVRGEDPQQP